MELINRDLAKSINKAFRSLYPILMNGDAEYMFTNLYGLPLPYETKENSHKNLMYLSTPLDNIRVPMKVQIYREITML